jgi:hypothetical protein
LKHPAIAFFGTLAAILILLTIAVLIPWTQIFPPPPLPPLPPLPPA